MNGRHLFLILSLIFSTPSVFSTPKRGFNQTGITEIDKFITQLQHQLMAIESTLRSLNITIVKEKLFRPKKRKLIQSFISQLMTLIESIKHETFRSADLETCQALTDFNYQLTLLIDAERTTQFRTVRSFDVKLFLQTVQRKKNTISADILKKFHATAKILATIEKEGLGLTRLNQTVRWVDNNLIAPAQRYSITSRTFGIAGALFFGGYFWNKFKKEDSLNVLLKGLNQLVKNEPENDMVKKNAVVESISASLEKSKNFLPIIYDFTDKGDAMWSKLIKHKSPVGEIGGAILLGYLLREFYTHIRPVITKKLNVWINKAKGGSYIKEADRLDKKVDKVLFKDVFGNTEIIRYLQFLVDYIEDSETHDRQGIRPPRGILCIGDTRTGKTHAVKAFLGEADHMLRRTNQIGKFRWLTPSVLDIKIHGMEKILQDAKAKAPCILFIDEIDLLDLQRTGENRTLSEFLTAMSDAVNSNDSRRQIFLIAATNCPETLDKALRQPGRFGKELRFEYPNFNDRVRFIKEKVFEFILPEQQQHFDIAKLAHYTNNQSYEAMHLFIKNAMMKAKIDNNGELTQKHLESTLEEDIFHIIPSHSKDIPLREQQVLAAHFAGQALALSLMESKVKLAKVTIKQVMTELQEKVMGSHLYDKKNKEQQRFEYGKLFTFQEQDPINMQTRQEKLNLIKLQLAGFVAEELLLGDCGYSCHAEDAHAAALTLAKSLTFQGIDEAGLPKHLVRAYYDEAIALKEECLEEVKVLLKEHYRTLKQTMEKLLEEQTLDHDQLECIVAAAA